MPVVGRFSVLLLDQYCLCLLLSRSLLRLVAVLINCYYCVAILVATITNVVVQLCVFCYCLYCFCCHHCLLHLCTTRTVAVLCHLLCVTITLPAVLRDCVLLLNCVITCVFSAVTTIYYVYLLLLLLL